MHNAMQKEQVIEYVERFSTYVNDIETFLDSYALGDKFRQQPDQIPAILNGEAATALNSIIPAKIRKKAGIFFTGHELSEKVAVRISHLIQSGQTIIDPACGAGNLLMSCAKYLPIGKNVNETLEVWSDRLFGYDLYQQFVQATRLRLILLAAGLHKQEDVRLALPNQHSVLKGIQVGNIFGKTSQTAQTGCVVVNPPFGHVKAPENCQWANGNVQIAGLFFEKIIKAASRGRNIVAILPDVLRSGTRYKKWREMVSGLSDSMDIELVGRFDKNTDVDVFILHIVASGTKNDTSRWPEAGVHDDIERCTISDLFDVHVGPVVPYRDPQIGKLHSYVDCSTAAPWAIVSDAPKRRFKGRIFVPPFVVIRRTSNPADKYRAVASIINTRLPIAVENHLIVLKPKDNTLEKCQALVLRLKDDKTNKWLNSRIRCRHLTVSAIKELPWWDL